ncbi:hypothetical protein 3 [Changjiang tombus-like virus 11]|uniref:hypothetical protein 3 n=1 Tax=Changjiang tombus-like virus 11 TaxID=1922804 RepID=UPI00090B37EF|nr:hypothetical protein 3 [Changjiang tombus-like virus 11]APG76276.1 hypothetical protein 3 [Changjiang tombus-like virus 11]
MAKTKQNNRNQNGKSTKNKGFRRRTYLPRQLGMTPFQALLADPCNGPVHSAYGGEAGITQRFVTDFTLNTGAGNTSGYLVFCPAANVRVQYEATASTIAGFPVVGLGPGATFLATNASKGRSAAACVTVIPAATSYNNLTGELAAANIGYNTLSTLTSTSVDGVFQLCNSRTVMAKQAYDFKWFPQELDATYAPSASGTGSFNLPDPSDHNAIVVAWRGYPAGVALSFRVTTVLEWTPVSNIGIATTTMPRAPVDHLREASALHTHNPHWWTNMYRDVGSHMVDQVGKGLKYLGSVGVQQGVRYATQNLMPKLASAAPLLLTL